MPDVCVEYSFAPNAVNPPVPLRDSYAQLQQAEQLRQQGKLDKAQAICESLVRRYPDYFGALHTLGLVYADRRNYQRALDCLIRAVMLNPRSWTTLTALSGVYLRLDAKELAAQTLEQTRAIQPHDPDVLLTLGDIYRAEREYELAREAYREALAIDGNFVQAALGLGSCYSDLGEYGKAANVFEDLIKKGERLPDLAFALTDLPASVVTLDLLKELEHLVKAPGDDESEFENLLAFGRAAALDKAQRYLEAWEQLVPANRKMFTSVQEDFRELSQRQRALLASLRANPGNNAHGDDPEQPISLFILGPSRSGKTTLEMLVATLEDIKRGYENPIVENAVRRASQTAGLLTRNSLEDLPAELGPLCCEIYLEQLGRRAGSAKVFTNTQPSRINNAASMIAALPNVRFLFVKRDVEDNLLRIYMRKYRNPAPYAYDLKTARNRILWYHQMMDLMAQKFPRVVRIIRYEDVVACPAAVVQVVADLCGLPIREGRLPAIGDDRGCAEPYRELMRAELGD